MDIKTAVLCDDVRQEDNGKFIIIGVYSESILVNAFPGRFLLSMWIEIKADRDGDVKIQFRAVDGENDSLSQVNGIMHVVNHNEVVTVVLPKLPIQVQAPTELKFQFREEGKRWKTLKTVSVAQIETEEAQLPQS